VTDDRWSHHGIR